MKKLLLILISFPLWAQYQPHFNENPFFTFSAAVDPVATYNEGGLDINAEIEYVGKGYVKAGIETHLGLNPNYTDIHGAFGINIMAGYWDEWRNYAGIRLGRIFRENKSRGELFGLEAGFDYQVTETFFVGLRATYDYRNDGERLGWKEYWQGSGSFRVGVKF